MTRVRRTVNLLVAIPAVALAAAGSWAVLRPAPPEPIKQPELRWEQTDTAVLLHVNNTNRTWGLRDQPVVVVVFGQHIRFRSYHPGQPERTASGEPFECCRIDYLPPGGTYTIRLLPEPLRVAGITVDIRDKNPWKRMKPN